LVISLHFTKIINLFALNRTALSDLAIIELNTIDSTNNYAMQLIDANKAYHGLTVSAQTQTGGKGQRGKVWVDRPGECLLMSIILVPKCDIKDQFTFNAAISVAIANVLQKLDENWHIYIKWPNDMIVNDKKAGGILIENVIRGSKWTHCIVGIGINIRQEKFHVELPFATSLRMASGREFDTKMVRDEIIESILPISGLFNYRSDHLEQYNSLLYKKGKKQKFSDAKGAWEGTVLNVQNNGTLEVQLENGAHVFYQHGQVEWVWG
jgi:BirA family transcriptional regulator, biotin operon repressor / biotin---[acetyl-CoA-carboxylase] ligase